MPSIGDRLSLISQRTYQHVFRAGGGDEGSGEIDFSVLSVAVTTLGLILCVELLRHRLDIVAIGKPFMKTVLEGVYRELATLGIVEFFIFLLHKYYEDLNIAQELVFADVHFTLFFTALFNAIQSCVMAFFVSRHSDMLWVQTEYQDLHHYVEIREEFDRIEKELLNLKYEEEEEQAANPGSIQLQAKARRADSRSSISSRLWSNNATTTTRLRLVGAVIVRFFKYPALTRKHHALLVQVRFHELKFHFLQANKLPITMHVSDYMKRCELHILQSLVHISTFAWLLLTGGVNLLYFLMGVVVQTTDGDLSAVSKSLTGLYFTFILLFVLLSLIIWYKMNWIFGSIMHMKLVSQAGGSSVAGSMEDEPTSIRRVQAVDEEGREFRQRSLFWGSSPRYITIMIQFMQFGFALALSILLVFWDTVDNQDGVDGGWFVLGVLLCNAAFVYIISHVVPRFTLCTSIGQMVDQRRLHETLARHRLEQAQREREQQLVEKEMERSFISHAEADLFKPVTKAMQTIGSVVLPEKKKQPGRASTAENELLEKLVMTNTKELRSTLPKDEQDKLKEREQRMQDRRNRRKTLSDGVEAMRNMVVRPSENEGSSEATLAARRASRRENRRRSVSASASIQMMRAGIEAPKPVEAPVKTKDDFAILADERAKRRANRKKTMSASADIRMMRMATQREGAMSASNLKAAPTSLLDTSSTPFKIQEGVPATAKVEAESNELATQRKDAVPASNFKPTSLLDTSSTPFKIQEGVPATAKVEAESNELATQRKDAVPASNFKPTSLLDTTSTPFKIQEGVPATAKVEAESRQLAEPQYVPPKRHVPSLAPIQSMRDVSDSFEESEPEISMEMVFDSKSEQPSKLENGTDTKTETESDFDDADDMDDVPEVQACDRKQKEVGLVPKPSFSDHWRSYFRGRVYVVVSAVFGTMICFFFIGMRLEAVLLETGVLPDLGNTWNFPSHVVFWFETAWLTLLIAGDAIIIFLFRPSHLVDNRDRSVSLAAIMDMILALLCMGFLMGAQVQRCCSDTGKRWLAGEEKADDYAEIVIECCPAFGHRLYGGFGDLEMFTSLIALRLLRFLIAGITVRRLDRKYRWSEVAAETTETSLRLVSVRATHPFDPLYDKTLRGGQDKSLEDETGTIVELWKSALGLYPDIVEKHGEFSGELLQAMLGIAVVEDDRMSQASTSQRRFEPEMETVVERSDEELSAPPSNAESPQKASRSSPPKPRRASRQTSGGDLGSPIRPQKRASITADRRYSGLSPDAQSIILAGQLGKPVRPRRESKDNWDGSVSLGRLLEESSNSVGAHGGFFGESHATGKFPLEFEVGPELAHDDSSDQYFAPNARLIRNMRRCDRKVLPLLGKWASVDMVMTKYEIVYFDATDIDDIDSAESPSPHTKRMQDIRQALRATKGGKGLRLRDVAYGRRLVGHQEIKNIEMIHVERILPHLSRVSEEEPSPSPEADEFWKENNVQKVDETERPSRDSRWAFTEEDRLKLETKHDTIYLRFYSDLERTSRVQVGGEAEGEFYKNNAFHYCQTLGRLIGSTKLRQELPHFGEDNADELRDFLVIVELPSSDDKKFKWNTISHRRLKSEGHVLPSIPVAALFGHRRQQSEGHADASARSSSQNKAGRRSSSFEEGSEPSKRPFRRSHSTGDDDGRGKVKFAGPVVVEPHNSDDKKFKWKPLSHRRQKSEGHAILPSIPLAGHRRQQSEGQADASARSDSPKKGRPFRRSHSAGDDDGHDKVKSSGSIPHVKSTGSLLGKN